MSDMTRLLLIGSIAVTIITATTWPMRSPRVQDAQMDRLARAVDLAVKPSIATQLRHRVAVRARASAGSILALMWLMTLAALLADWAGWPLAGLDPMLGFLYILVIGGGNSLGPAVVGLVEALRFTDDGRRVARAGATRITSYVPRAYLVGAVVVPVLAAVLAIVELTQGVTERHDITFSMPLLVAWVAGSALLSAACIAACALIVRRPEPASDSWELAWQDALRADVLRQSLSFSMLWSGTVLVLLSVAPVGTPMGGRMPVWCWVIVGGVWAAMAFLAGWGLKTACGRPRRYYRTQLWPSAGFQAPPPGQGSAGLPGGTAGGGPGTPGEPPEQGGGSASSPYVPATRAPSAGQVHANDHSGLRPHPQAGI